MTAPVKLTPFSGKNYHSNAASKGTGHCALCGKPTRGEYWVRVVDGGDRFATRDEHVEHMRIMRDQTRERSPISEDGDMGCWPVGPDCAKALMAAGEFVWGDTWGDLGRAALEGGKS